MIVCIYVLFISQCSCQFEHFTNRFHLLSSCSAYENWLYTPEKCLLDGTMNLSKNAVISEESKWSKPFSTPILQVSTTQLVLPSLARLPVSPLMIIEN